MSKKKKPSIEKLKEGLTPEQIAEIMTKAKIESDKRLAEFKKNQPKCTCCPLHSPFTI